MSPNQRIAENPTACAERLLQGIRTMRSLDAPCRYRSGMAPLDRVTRSIDVMGGKPCVGGTRVTVGTVVGLVAAGKSTAEILDAYQYLDEQDVMQALAYAAWRVEEIEIPISA